MTVCPQCGQENPDGARFCNACALPLEAAPAARESRKTVTVLFCDVAGYTEAGERMDPEALRRLQSRYFDDARVALERHGATVEKFIGDAVMAVFGIPQLHEDDALRAVRAALELRDAVSALGLEARIGVNTGEVVAGSGDALVTGDAVNVAARLEQAAEPGVILIGESTHRLLSVAVTSELGDPVDAKGKSEPLRAWRLLEVLAGAEAVPRRLDSPMVGREQELALLRQTYERVARERRCYLFTILGSAGIGKSRLASELVASTGDGTTTLSGRCLPYGEGITYWPLSEILEDLAQGEIRARLADLLRGEQDAELIADRLGAALGESPATGGSEETFWAVRKLFERLAQDQPLVVVFDDLHWAEPTFLDLVEHVADWSRDAPILLVCLARPELLESRPSWGGGKVNAASILLEPLSDDDSSRLIDVLPALHHLPMDTKARITAAAEGNPLFVEQMLAMLDEQGQSEAVSIPPTIQALVAARLDRLEPTERAVIEHGAIEGKLFHRDAVCELVPQPARASAGTNLMSLVRKELIRPDRPGLGGGDTFRFHHLVIRDAAYDAIPKEARADLHERFADWLEQQLDGRVGEYEEIVGYHLEQAALYHGELGKADDDARALARRAAERLLSAGDRAADRLEPHAAASFLERATSLLGENDPLQARILPALGRALVDAGQFEEAEATLREAMNSAAAGRDAILDARLRLPWLNLRIATDSEVATDEIRQELERILPLLEQAGDESDLARWWQVMALVHWTGAQAAATEAALERAAPHAKNAGDKPAAAACAHWIAVAQCFGPTPASQAIAHSEALLGDIAGSRLQEVQVQYPLIGLYAMQGRIDEARSLIAQIHAVMEEFGWPGGGWGGGQIEAFAELSAGNPEAAETHLRAGYDRLERQGDKAFLSTTAAHLGEALLALGQLAEAEHFTEVSEKLGASDDFSNEVYWRRIRSQVLTARGELEGAERLAREAVELAAQTDWLDLHASALVQLGNVLDLRGCREESIAALEEALRLYERKEHLVGAATARERLAELRG
jgi:class 3 adenylate cyclase/tetratricopeptide (TPR) repeat protein